MFEREPITKLVKKKNLAAYKHENFWFCVDTLRDKNVLENIYKKNKKFGKFIIMNVLITGGSGYLGSIFAEKLHSDFSIICGSQKKILSKKKIKKIKYKKLNYKSFNSLKKNFKGIDVVIHLVGMNKSESKKRIKKFNF